MADTNKTEPCTPKKRSQARDRGEVARSMELGAAMNMIVGLSVVFVLGGYIFGQFSNLLHEMLNTLEKVPLNQASVVEVMRLAGGKVVMILLPIMAAIMVAMTIINFIQVGFKITPQAMQPKFSKLSPINGVKKIFGMRGWIELVKSVVKIGIVSVIVWFTVKEHLPIMVAHIGSPLKQSLPAATKLFWDVIWRLGMFFFVVGIADYVWQKYEFERKMRMTKQEVKDEYRQAEGDQKIKSSRRAKHRRLAQSRMAAEVAKADVVTTNPTHYAVALRYDQFKMRAPKVVAKGERLWAKMIIRIARKHQVPVIENKLVTRAMYHNVEIGREVPPKLYRAVAEVLAALYKLRSKRGWRT
ncbi:flagellar biosynthesis protein FlhB [bacterium]|nr:flagellar biosynthesis protein FlhB [bacterium]